MYDYSGALANTGCVQDAIRPLLQPQQITSNDDSDGCRSGKLQYRQSPKEIKAPHTQTKDSSNHSVL